MRSFEATTATFVLLASAALGALGGCVARPEDEARADESVGWAPLADQEAIGAVAQAWNDEGTGGSGPVDHQDNCNCNCNCPPQGQPPPPPPGGAVTPPLPGGAVTPPPPQQYQTQPPFQYPPTSPYPPIAGGPPPGGLPGGGLPGGGLPGGGLPVGGLPVGGLPVGGLPVGGCAPLGCAPVCCPHEFGLPGGFTYAGKPFLGIYGAIPLFPGRLPW